MYMIKQTQLPASFLSPLHKLVWVVSLVCTMSCLASEPQQVKKYNDYRDVQVTENPAEIPSGLNEYERITVTHQNQSMRAKKNDLEIKCKVRLQHQAFEKECFTVLIIKKEIFVQYGELPSIECQAVLYR